DDSDPCTNNQCVGGICVFPVIDCDDSAPCTLDSCSQGNCINTLNCDDGDNCTIDSCGASGCGHRNVVCPPDSISCTDEVCVNGECQSVPHCCQLPSDCDDLDPCTTNNCVNSL